MVGDPPQLNAVRIVGWPWPLPLSCVAQHREVFPLANTLPYKAQCLTWSRRSTWRAMSQWIPRRSS
ncbi:hypothetical protein B0H10DRAFT_2159175, partial [Mycena sp. CBHHK59/15]